MSQEPIYKTDYSKYNRINYQRCCFLESDFRRSFHTCPPLMERKKQLEYLVRRYRESRELSEHFKTDYKNRKIEFYRKIIYEILKEENKKEKEICNIVKDILFIYSKKREEQEYIEHLSNHLEAEESHREEMRESMIEQFRGCD